MSQKGRSCCGSIQPRNGRRRRSRARPCIRRLPRRRACRLKPTGSDKITFPAELMQKASDPSAQRAMGDQKRRFEERRAARKIEISILEERIAQSQRQIQGNNAQSKATRAQFDSVSQEYTKLKPLADQGIVPFARVATLERSKADLEGRIGAYEADIARYGRVIDEVAAADRPGRTEGPGGSDRQADRDARPTRRCAREAARRRRRSGSDGGACTALRTYREFEGAHGRSRGQGRATS